MPRYFFDTYDGDLFVKDEIGQELDSLETAEAQAQRSALDMARDKLPDGGERSFVVGVRDETGRDLLRIALSMVVAELDPDT